MNSNTTTQPVFPDYQDNRWKEETNKENYNLQQELRTYVRVFNSKEGRYYLIPVRRRVTFNSNAKEEDFTRTYIRFIRDCYITMEMTDFTVLNKINVYSPFILDENQEPEKIRIRKQHLSTTL